MLSQAAFPAIAFGEPGRSGLGLHLTGALDPVSIGCSTVCFILRKSGLVSDGYSEINFWYFGGILFGISGEDFWMDWTAQT